MPSISGTVTDDAADPIRLVTVTVYDPSGPTPITSARTDSQGIYGVSVPSDTYDVIAQKPGYASGASTGLSVTSATTVDFSLDPLPSKVVGERASGPAVGVTGRVTDTAGIPVGVLGDTEGDGYGLYTPGDARVDGQLDVSLLSGPIVGNEIVSYLAGPGLSLGTDGLDAPPLPDYDEVGTDPDRTVAALRARFRAARWGARQYRSTASSTSFTSSAFSDAVLAPTGDVVFVPALGDAVGLYDPVTDTYSSGATHGVSNSAYAGGVLAPTGEIVFAPYYADGVGVYDPVDDTITSVSHSEGDQAFDGAAVAPNGDVVLAPHDSDYVGVYDPFDGTYSRKDQHNEGDGAFIDAVLAPTGDVVLVPWGASSVGVYDAGGSGYSQGAGFSDGFSYADGTLAPTGDVIFTPGQGSAVGIYDPVADAYTTGASHGEGNFAFAGGVLGPTGNVIFTPDDSTNVGVYDPVSDAYTSGPTHGEAGSLDGGALTPTGIVVLPPATADNVGVYDARTGASIEEETALHPLVNNS